MVRVGGGWDTLQNYLDKHDPCRCRKGEITQIFSRLAGGDCARENYSREYLI